MNQEILKLHRTAKLAIQCGQEMADGVTRLGQHVASSEIKTALLELLRWPAAEVRARCVEVLGRKYWDEETRWAFAALLTDEKSDRVIKMADQFINPPKP